MPGAARDRLAAVGLGLVLACGLTAPDAAAFAGSTPQPPTIYHKNRVFRIPFHVEDVDRPRLLEVQLWVSEDSGFTWKPAGRTPPDRPSFIFRAERDAEYWFAVRTVDTKGRLYPPDDKTATVEPGMKVVVDTTPPSLIVEPQTRRGSQASVRWEVRDEHLDLPSFALEYQVEGAREWRLVPIRRPALIGEQSWDAGSADRLKVRASVSDKAGNSQQVELTLPDGTPANPELVGGPDPPDFAAPPPITPISSGPAFPGGDDPPRGSSADPFNSAPASPSGSSNPEDAADPFAAASAAAPAGGANRTAPGGQTLLVGSPRFALQYAVDDAGPSGPALVELWVTRDGGRTWSRLGEDPDRVSPFLVDLTAFGSDGTYGLSLVARSASGLGDQPPAPGEAPQMWVEVDATPPLVQLDPPRVGTGLNAGKVAITWRASDSHLGTRPVIISYRPDQPGARWQPITERIDNTGRLVWAVPASVPARFHLRVDVADTLGNRGSAETTETGPVLVDRTRPRGRIIGLDSSARSGPSARPMR